MDLDRHLAALDRRRIPSDLDRILSMPRTLTGPNENAADLWTRRLSKGAHALRPIQGAALSVVEAYGGGFGSIGVGHGKTLIALLAGEAAGAKNPLILTPPSLVGQMEADADLWADRFSFVRPLIVSYGALSTQTDLLDRLRPDLIVADEAHYLRHRTSARTRRFLRYFSVNPRCGFLALSGTITAKSLLDYAHLLELSLRGRAPVPLNRWELERWAACIDPDGEPTKADLDRLGILVRWSGQSHLAPACKETIRRAFRERLTTTPGVIATREGSCEASIHLIKHTPAHSPAVKAALKTLTEKWETPDGEPIADASTKSRAYRQISLGFFYRWDWGEAGPDEEWLEARRAVDRLVGRTLRYASREGRDSPALVIEWSRAGGGAAPLRDAITLWDRIKDRAAPTLYAVWICQEKMQYISDWVFESGDPALIWYTSTAVGASLAFLGLPVHGAGSLCPTSGHAAASIRVHGKGRNLQQYRTAFILEPPANGGTFEQLLGRTHRAGQAADMVEWHYFDFGGAVDKAKTHAEYIEQTQGTRQKLNQAVYLTA